MIRNLTLLLDALGGGGAARVAAVLSSGWAAQGRRVTLLTTDDGHGGSPYALPEGILHVPLALRGASRNPFQAVMANGSRLVKLREAIRASAPDILISFLDTTNVKCLLATRGLGIPTLVSERTDPHGRSIGWAWSHLRRLSYPWAQGLVTQSRHALEFFPKGIQTKGWVIPNPVLAPPGEASPTSPGRFQVVSLGSLRHVKGHDLLIEAFHRTAPGHPLWELVIHGEGPDRGTLERQIEVAGLAGRVHLPGSTREPGSRLREADLFVLSSRTEGFPNALAEAMACGLPVVAFDCASGPSELIRPGIDGLLVPPGDVAALAEAMGRLMEDAAERDRLAARAPDVLDRFSLDRILQLWEDAIQAAVARA